jgi:hypothetical protein
VKKVSILENNIRNLAQIQYTQEAFVCLLYVQKMAFLLVRASPQELFSLQKDFILLKFVTESG